MSFISIYTSRWIETEVHKVASKIQSYTCTILLHPVATSIFRIIELPCHFFAKKKVPPSVCLYLKKWKRIFLFRNVLYTTAAKTFVAFPSPSYTSSSSKRCLRKATDTQKARNSFLTCIYNA